MTEFIIHLGWLTLSLSVVILATLLWSRVFGKRFSARSRYLTWTVVVLSLCIGLLLFRLPALFTLEVSMPILENEVILPTEDLPEQMEHTPSEPESTPIISDEQVYDPIGNTQSPTDTPFVPDDAFPSVEPSTPNISTPTVPTSPSPSNPVTNEPVTQPSVSVTPPSEPTEQHEKAPSIDLPLLLFCIWGVGAVSFFSIALLVYIRSVHKYNRKRELCDKETLAAFHVLCRDHDIEHIPQLYICEGIGSPVLYGYTAPVILIPKLALPKEALVGVLAHELTHYRRRDLWVKLLCVLAEALHWFNPLVHIAAARCNAEMELSCDEAVLAGLSADVRRAYGSTMLEILKHCNTKRSLLTTQFNPHKNAVKERFVNILDMTTKKHGKAVIVTVLMLCLIFGVAIGCTTASAESTDEATDTTKETDTTEEADTSKATEETEKETGDITEEITPSKDETAPPAFDIESFAALHWNTDIGRAKSYLLRSDILAFDALAEELGIDANIAPTLDDSFSYAMSGGEKSLFGIDGYVFYHGSATAGELSPNIAVSSESPLYDEYFIYNGTGEELKYDGLYFSSMNLSLDDYTRLLTSIAELANMDPASFLLVTAEEDGSIDWNHPTNIKELGKRLGISDTDAVANHMKLHVDVHPNHPIIIPLNDTYRLRIEIYWRYWEKFSRNYATFKNRVPLGYNTANQLEVYISLESYWNQITPDIPDGPPLPYNASLDTLCHAIWAKELTHGAAVLYPAFQNAVVKEFSKHTAQPLTWEDLQYSVNAEADKYQYTFWCQSESSYMIYLQCGISGTMDPNGNTSFGLDWLEPPYLIFGPYAAGDELCFDSSNLENERGTYLVNITAMRAELDKKLDLPGYQIQEYGIQVIGDDMIYAPLLHNGRCYLAHIRIKPSREYELVGNLLQDFPNGSPYEFFMEYRAFGILPIDLVRNHVPHPLNPEGILSEYLNENGTVKDGVLIGSSFMSTPHITVRVDESDINYYLIHRKSGKVIERDDITKDMRYEDLYWGFRPVTNQDVIAMYEKIFAAEMKIRSPYYRTSVYFGDCQLYEGVVWKSSNRCAYIDFDGDGLLEALVQSGANGENILHYDVKTETVYATYLSARGGYIYFANGEFCHYYEYDLSRYRVHSFVGCVAKLIKIMYTDTEPQNQIPAWFDVEIKPSQS